MAAIGLATVGSVTPELGLVSPGDERWAMAVSVVGVAAFATGLAIEPHVYGVAELFEGELYGLDFLAVESALAVTVIGLLSVVGSTR